MSQGPTFVFLCKKYPELQLRMKQDHTTIIDGQIVRQPSHYLLFRRTPIGGIYKTKKVDEAEHMRETPQFLENLIVEMDEDELIKALEEAPVATGVALETGGVGTKPGGQAAPAAPAAEVPAQPGAAKGPRRQPAKV